MAAGDATAADVPGRYDVVLDGKGYVFADSIEPSLPFRTHRAIYDITPTFVQRSNVSNQYGDNAQDFFLTARQRDWSLGEQQKFFRAGSDGRYWMGQNIDVSTPGQVKLQPAFGTSASLAESVVGGCRERGVVAAMPKSVAAGTTKLYDIDATGASTDLGVHGLGVAPGRHGICGDGNSVFISSAAAGTVGVRRWSGSAYSTFSATGSDALAFVNNTLYGLQGFKGGTVALIQYDGAGTATTLFTWKGAEGGTPTDIPGPSKLEAYGGKLLILLGFGQDAGGELWIYDGTGTSRLEVFPPNYYAYDLEVLYGVAYISGSFLKAVDASNAYPKPCIHFFDGSQVGKLWEANDYTSFAISDIESGPHPALTVFAGKIIFNDDTTGNMMAYDPVHGGVSSIASYTATAASNPRLFTSGVAFVHTRTSGTYRFFPGATYATSGYVISSLADLESSLTKQFRGVTVEWAAAADGDGGSVDIAYQVGSVDGSWTTLQTGAVSGTEYTFTNISGRSIALKITLNKGTSTSGPTLKSWNLRAAPVLKQFRSSTYILDCTGDSNAPRMLRDNTPHPLTGYDQVANLMSLAKKTSPFSVTDRLGTYTALVDLQDQEGFDVYEEHPNLTNPAKSGSYLARVKVREV